MKKVKPSTAMAIAALAFGVAVLIKNKKSSMINTVISLTKLLLRR